MRNKQKIRALATIIMVSALSAGCSKGGKSVINPEAKYYSVNMDGERLEIPEDDERITALGQLCNEFIPVVMNRDYINPDVMSEYQYYTEEYAETLKASGRPELLKQSIMDNELILTVEEVDITGIQIYRMNGEPAATITADYIQRFEHSIEGYFDSMGVKQNGRYKRTMTISLKCQNDKWGVYKYSSTARVEVN